MTIEIKNSNQNPIQASSKIKFIMFPGAGLTSADEALSSIDFMKNIFTENNVPMDNVEFHSFYYSEKSDGDIGRFNNDEMIDNNIKDVAKLFYPLLEPKEKAQENMSNIIMQGHCQGALVVAQLGNLLCEKMDELGYDKDTKDAIAGQITTLISGSGLDNDKIKAKYDTYQFVNLADKTAFFPAENSRE